MSLASPPALDISGVLLDASGSPVPELWLHAENAAAEVPEHGASAPALTNEHGEFQLRGLAPGAYVISLDGEEGTPLVASINAGARDLVLRLPE